MAFIEAHADRRSADGLRWGVEPICRVLSAHGLMIAPSTYYAHRCRPRSARTVRDAELVVEINRVHGDRAIGRGLYGARKVWHQLLREGLVVPRCQVERLMKAAGLRGIRRGKRFVTTTPDKAAARPPDLVKRDFSAERPNLLWLVDFTYVATWSGMAFTAFVSDAFSRRIVGWRTAASMPTELPLDALDMALWTRARAGEGVKGLVHHSDAGSQGEIKWSSQHLETEVVQDDQQAPAPTGDPRDAREALVAGSSVDGSARGSSPVLGGDHPRAVERGCCRGGRRVIRGWDEVVPGGWRNAIARVGPGVGPLPVPCRARGDRDPQRTEARSP